MKQMVKQKKYFQVATAGQHTWNKKTGDQVFILGAFILAFSGLSRAAWGHFSLATGKNKKD